MEIAPIIFNNNKNLQKVMENDIRWASNVYHATSAVMMGVKAFYEYTETLQNFLS